MNRRYFISSIVIVAGALLALNQLGTPPSTFAQQFSSQQQPGGTDYGDNLGDVDTERNELLGEIELALEKALELAHGAGNQVTPELLEYTKRLDEELLRSLKLNNQRDDAEPTSAQQFSDAIRRLRTADDLNQREEMRTLLSELLQEQIDLDLDARAKKVDALAQRVDELRRQLETRRENKDKTVQMLLLLAESPSSGLGIPQEWMRIVLPPQRSRSPFDTTDPWNPSPGSSDPFGGTLPSSGGSSDPFGSNNSGDLQHGANPFGTAQTTNRQLNAASDDPFQGRRSSSPFDDESSNGSNNPFATDAKHDRVKIETGPFGDFASKSPRYNIRLNVAAKGTFRPKFSPTRIRVENPSVARVLGVIEGELVVQARAVGKSIVGIYGDKGKIQYARVVVSDPEEELPPVTPAPDPADEPPNLPLER